MLARAFAVIPCLIIAWSTTVNADVLVLRDGRKLDGILSNSELVRNDPAAFVEISFLVGSGPNAVLHRFPTSGIEWILVEEPHGSSVIDFSQVSTRPRGEPVAVPKPPDRPVALRLDIKGGYTWARFHGPSSDEFHGFREGKSIGASLTMLRGGTGGATIGAYYVQKGALGRTATINARNAQIEYRMDYVEVPLLVVGRIPVGRSALRAFGGPVLAFPVSSTVVGEGWSWFGSPGLDGEQDIYDRTAKVDWGLRLGLGVELGLTDVTSLLIEGNYSRTISPFDEHDGTDWTHGVLNAEIGLSIALNPDAEKKDDRSPSRPRWEMP